MVFPSEIIEISRRRRHHNCQLSIFNCQLRGGTPSRKQQFILITPYHKICQKATAMYGKPKSAHTTFASHKKEEETDESSCQQVHRMHRQVLRISLRHRELLLHGSHSGGHPRSKPHHGPVHRLQVLPQEITQ